MVEEVIIARAVAREDEYPCWASFFYGEKREVNYRGDDDNFPSSSSAHDIYRLVRFRFLLDEMWQIITYEFLSHLGESCVSPIIIKIKAMCICVTLQFSSPRQIYHLAKIRNVTNNRFINSPSS